MTPLGYFEPNLHEWHDVRCPNCGRLLFRIKGLAIVETVCKRCSCKSIWPDLNSKAVDQLDGKKKVE